MNCVYISLYKPKTIYTIKVSLGLMGSNNTKKTSSSKKYHIIKLYVKDEETKKAFKHLIVDFGTSDAAIKQIVLSYQSGLLKPICI